ncbi:ABC transporter ATP-binding protein [Methanofervidicoccus abyssi]|uniref:Iron complex transport system ATP-binding protein n=1 Tax=Methanofervidicoccus abyssi TaxID=2082189 RepID=A0A401HR14_9EURY|nr:ABC transporter ATP-binding protein [Methanofervidicoccus abyssi]GBF36698.1 iron complex transport system ATP-binding protein [Methanofervidicoccus abyssi]
MLKTENLSVGYDNYVVVEGINLEIKNREILCIIGPNGAGKSTLLKTIATYLKPKRGIVYLNGRNIHRLSPREIAREMSVVLTERVNPGNLTGYDIVAIGRHPYTDIFGRLSKRDKEIIEYAAASVNATHLLSKNFFEMSDGERQKIMIARALAQEPRVLILDEPTSFLDAKHKIELTILLRKLATENNLAIVVTLHDIELALRVADKIALIKNGRIIAYGHPEDVMKREVVNNLYDLESANYSEVLGYFELKSCGKRDCKVFLICGGGTGVNVMRFLVKNEYSVTVGVLHKNDIDYTVAETMELKIVEEEPYNPISQKSYERALEEIRSSDVVIYTDFPIGEMNKLNKELVEESIKLGKYVVKYDGNVEKLKERLNEYHNYSN